VPQHALLRLAASPDEGFRLLPDFGRKVSELNSHVGVGRLHAQHPAHIELEYSSTADRSAPSSRAWKPNCAPACEDGNAAGIIVSSPGHKARPNCLNSAAFAQPRSSSLLSEEEDAQETKRLVEETGRKIVLVSGDLQQSAHCRKVVDTAVGELGGSRCPIR
jgi:hypothetical protein